MFFLILILFLLIGGLVTLVAVHNSTPSVPLELLSWHTSSLPLSVWLIAAFLCGAIVLYLVSFLSAMGDREKIKALRQHVLKLEERITTMSRTNSSSARQRAGDSISTADTGPLLALPDMMNTSQPGGRIPTSPLSPRQKFPQ